MSEQKKNHDKWFLLISSRIFLIDLTATPWHLDTSWKKYKNSIKKPALQMKACYQLWMIKGIMATKTAAGQCHRYHH